MRGLKKKLIATIASVAVLAGAFTIITKSTYASYDGNEPFLQGGIEFGILANYINQTSDMETNFFAGKYTREMENIMEIRFQVKPMVMERFALENL